MYLDSNCSSRIEQDFVNHINLADHIQNCITIFSFFSLTMVLKDQRLNENDSHLAPTIPIFILCDQNISQFLHMRTDPGKIHSQVEWYISMILNTFYHTVISLKIHHCIKSEKIVHHGFVETSVLANLYAAQHLVHKEKSSIQSMYSGTTSMCD